MPIQDFEVLSKLGAGAFGTVFKVRRKEDGKIYAMKRVDISKLSPKEVDDALTEVRILASVRHRNVVSFLEAFVERARELIMVLDFCDAGDLSQQIDLHRNQRRYLPEARIWHYLIQLVDGLDCLHALRIVHRDVKPANAFLTAAGDVRLGDLNVSKVAKDGLLRTQIGTPYFMAPEIWADKPYSESCDVWSLGCVAYELCALKPPFNSRSIAGLGRAVRSGVYDPLSRSFSPPLRDLVASLLTVRPASRPTCAFLAKSAAFEAKRAAAAAEDGDGAAASGHAPLLGTIKVPRSAALLTSVLPKPCYPDARPNSPLAWPATDRTRATALATKASSKASSTKGSDSGASDGGASARDRRSADGAETPPRRAANAVRFDGDRLGGDRGGERGGRGGDRVGGDAGARDGDAARRANDAARRDRHARGRAPARRGSDDALQRPIEMHPAAPAPLAQPTSPLPIKAGHVNSLLRGAMHDVNARADVRNDFADPNRHPRQPRQPPRQPPRYSRHSPEQGPDPRRPLPYVEPASRIQAVLRGSRTRRMLSARDRALRNPPPAAGGGRNNPSWWG